MTLINPTQWLLIDESLKNKCNSKAKQLFSLFLMKQSQKANRTYMTMSDPQAVAVLPSQRTFAFFQLVRPDLARGDHSLLGPGGQGTA